MAAMLPYEFDTSAVVKLILRGVLILLAVVLMGILYSLLVSHSLAAAIQLVVIIAMLTFFGRLLLKNLTCSAGTITDDAVVVEPIRLYGIRLACPAGRFPIRQFEAVRVERVTAPMIVDGMIAQRGPYERVCLVGRVDTPEILIARSELDAGRRLGIELAAALKLPYQEQVVPY